MWTCKIPWPGGAAVVSVAPPVMSPSELVGDGASLERTYCITQQQRRFVGIRQRLWGFCTHGFYRRGSCLWHKTERFVYIPCRRRFCEVCGPIRSRGIAERIRRGLETFGGGAWFVGTFSFDIDKPKAVYLVGRFVQVLRRGEKEYLLTDSADSRHWQTRFELRASGVRCPKSARWRWRLKPQPGLRYACTWEVTKAGRLHVNLVLAPWSYVPQSILSRKWRYLTGARVVWIERITSPSAIGDEVTKAKHTRRLRQLCDYFAKNEQQVEDGRGACYSSGWPLLLKPDHLRRKGDGHLVWENFFSDTNQVEVFEYERDLGHWREIRLGEWGKTEGDCRCFDPDDGLGDLRAFLLMQSRDNVPSPPAVDKFNQVALF
ncbi:hypothetical protein ES703_21556 [subsurface metagenome]